MGLFTLALQFCLFFVFHCRHVYMWHCKCYLEVTAEKWNEMKWNGCTDQCNVSVHFVWLSIEFPLGLRNENNFLVCLCEDSILIYVKRFKFTLYIYHTIILIKYYLTWSKPFHPCIHLAARNFNLSVSRVKRIKPRTKKDNWNFINSHFFVQIIHVKLYIIIF